jgi:hypothetical protein
MNILTDEIVQWQFERVRACGYCLLDGEKIAILCDEVRNFTEDRATSAISRSCVPSVPPRACALTSVTNQFAVLERAQP